jgi:hypothetical protein
MSAQQRLEQWRQRLSGFVPGRISVRQWCEQEGISQFQFHYWSRRLAQAAADTPAGWLAVEVGQGPSSALASGGIHLHIQGVRIELEDGFDADMLRAVVCALGAS